MKLDLRRSHFRGPEGHFVCIYVQEYAVFDRAQDDETW